MQYGCPSEFISETFERKIKRNHVPLKMLHSENGLNRISVSVTVGLVYLFIHEADGII